jgi:hypothetical protein
MFRGMGSSDRAGWRISNDPGRNRGARIENNRLEAGGQAGPPKADAPRAQMPVPPFFSTLLEANSRGRDGATGGAWRAC